jgi:hypothetical protein
MEDADDGLSLLVVCALFLWDCVVYSGHGSIFALSHDEYGVAFEKEEPGATQLRQWLKELAVLR